MEVINQLNKNNTSGYTGISQDKVHGGWKTHITVNNKYIHLGRFEDINQAIAIRKQAEKMVIHESQLTPKEPIKLIVRKKKSYSHRYTKPVSQYDLTGKYLQTFKSAYEASKVTGINMNNIHRVASGNRNYTSEYVFKYTNSPYNLGEQVICQCCGKTTESDLLIGISIECLRKFKQTI